jgi:hypothetical protein
MSTTKCVCAAMHTEIRGGLHQAGSRRREPGWIQGGPIAGDGHGLPMDYDELERWTRVGFERGTASRRGEW